jgi:signal peptidase II
VRVPIDTLRFEAERSGDTTLRGGTALDVTGEAGAARVSRVSPNARRWTAFVLLVSTVAAIDQAAKEAVRSTFAPGEGVDMFGAYEILHVQNEGVAGGSFQGSALPLAALSVMVVVGLYEFLAQRKDTILLLLGFGLLVGGGVGNLVDRARQGWVTDFIRDGEWAFNLADLAIFAGGWLVLAALVASLYDLARGRRQPTSRGA